MNRCAACIAAGTTGLCLHLVALDAHEAAHPHQPGAKPGVFAALPPPKPDENPREFDRRARFYEVTRMQTAAADVWSLLRYDAAALRALRPDVEDDQSEQQ